MLIKFIEKKTIKLGLKMSWKEKQKILGCKNVKIYIYIYILEIVSGLSLNISGWKMYVKKNIRSIVMKRNVILTFSMTFFDLL